MNPIKLIRGLILSVSLAITLALLAGCSTAKNGSRRDYTPTPPSSKRSNLDSLESAVARAHQIGKIRYSLWFGLDGAHEEFEGRAVIQFEVKERAELEGKSTFIDLFGASISTLVINHVAVPPQNFSEYYDGARILLKLKDLNSGTNRIEIAYSKLYSKNGSGFHRFKDPIDQNVYVYTNLEPGFAKEVFPCFDQPDLKGTYELSVETPDHWVVIANTPSKENSIIDGRRSWAFSISPLQSTYLFALHAGPFTEWSVKSSLSLGIPLRLFARASIAHKVPVQDWFRTTIDGLKFFRNAFGTDYPYAKFDQVLVPEFNSGGMENLAAVLYHEDYATSDRPLPSEKEDLKEVILHELSHMWFGNLVTMRWWDDLWLNESFATFAAGWAMGSRTALIHERQFAYLADRLDSTHPISSKILRASDALAQFDGITYEKGAALLAQLRSKVGDKAFSKFLENYFRLYSYSNASADDFLKSFVESTAHNTFNPSSFRAQWIDSSGVNTLVPHVECKEGRLDLQKSWIEQSPGTGSKILREHEVPLSFWKFQKAGGRPKMLAEFPLSLKAMPRFDLGNVAPASFVIEGKGECPDFALMNRNETTYVLVSYPRQEAKSMLKGISGIQDAMTRFHIWTTTWRMVEDGDLDIQYWLAAFLASSPKETDSKILSFLNSRLQLALWYLRPESLSLTLLELETLALKVWKSELTLDQRAHWFDVGLSSLQSESGAKWAMSLLSSVHVPNRGLEIHQDRRWALLLALTHVSSKPEFQKVVPFRDLFEKEKLRDPSLKGKQWAHSIEARIDPDLWAKNLFQYAKGKTAGFTFSLAEAKSASSTVFHLRAQDFSGRYEKDYLELVNTYLSQSETKSEIGTDALSHFYRELLPRKCSPEWEEVLGRLQETSISNRDFNPSLRNAVIRGRALIARCLRVRAQQDSDPTP